VRANMLLEQIEAHPEINYSSQEAKNGYIAEAYFHRAGLYLDLARLFGNIPLVLTSVSDNPPQTSPDVVFGQICSDFLNAIALFPSTKWTDMTQEQRAHPTKWAAQGMLARAFLYYTGYYQKADVTLPDGTTLTKAQVIAQLEDCINNSGHSLISDFRNLWLYSYNKARTRYKFAVDNNLNYVGEDNTCPEIVWALKFTYQATALGDMVFNRLGATYGLRNQTQSFNNWKATFPFGQGWGQGSVNSRLYEQWIADDPTDIRLNGSILKDDNPAVEGNIRICYYNSTTYSGTRPSGATYSNQTVNITDWTQQTGYWAKKFLPINVWKNDAIDGTPEIYTTVLYGTVHDWRWKNSSDIYMLRFSDILLMAAELGAANAQSYFNRVHDRSSSMPRTVSLENIQKERRYEFAFEAQRFFDLQRWHLTRQTVVANRTNVKIWNLGKPVIYGDNTPGQRDVYNVYGVASLGARLDATGGLGPIPQSQINLSNGVLIQNPGWGPSDDYIWAKGIE